MAKDQNLSLNPTKISGICGRLMCCLKYENDCYCGGDCPHQQKKVLPPSQGARVVSVEGEGKVISLNQQRRSATILLDSGRTIVASWEDVIEKDEEETSMASSLMAAYEEQEMDGAELLADVAGDEEQQPRENRERRERRPRENRENRREGGHRFHSTHNRNRDSREHRRNNRDGRAKNNKRSDKRNRENKERH